MILPDAHSHPPRKILERVSTAPRRSAGMKGVDRARITPGGWEQRNGMRLRFVYRRGRHSLLVADDAYIGKDGLARQKRGRRRKRDGILRGAATVPIFVLVRQVRLKKRLDLEPVTRGAAARLPAAILRRWK